MAQRHVYGGQAVIEGVMIRGQRFVSLAVRRQNSQIATECKPINPIYSGSLRKLPLIRGIVVLIETLVLGIVALNRSAAIALEDQVQPGESQEFPKWAMTVTLVIALVLGIGLFFIMPLFATKALDDWVSSTVFSNFFGVFEGIIRLAVLVAYISLIGLIKDVRRVFSYHGAEHMTVHAHEAELSLNVENVRRFPTAHPRCGTAFLLTVMVVAIVVFSLLGRPPMVWMVLSRIVLIPVIAGISYEMIRFSGAHSGNRLVRAISYPSLLLQRLTTRQPDDGQIEVAIKSMETAIAADEGRELASVEEQPSQQVSEANPGEEGQIQA